MRQDDCERELVRRIVGNGVENRSRGKAMEYLVTMTTQVPGGTSEQDVADIRAREAARTHELASEGHVLRLWRPPLQPGEWRTIGLFSAYDSAGLEATLGSMPLRVWRSDDVTPLGRHPNDPGDGRTAVDPDGTEFLTTFAVTIPPGTPPATVDRLLAQEAERTRLLADEGRLIRLWTLPGHGRNLGLWQAADGDAMQGILRSLPMADWLTVDTVRLTRHPSDPGNAKA
jgi:muconolactone delta-isomerase